MNNSLNAADSRAELGLVESASIDTQKGDNKPLYGSRNINIYLKLIKRKYSYISIPELLSYADMELHQVEDEGHWFTQKQINLFYEKLVKLTGNKNIAREAGRYAASPDALGVVRKYILGFVKPSQAYELISKYAHLFTKSSKYETMKIGRTKIEVTVTPYEGVEEEPYQCENRFGYLDAIAQAFNYKLPKIQHPECLLKGGKACRYVVSWKESRSDYWRKIRNYTALLLFSIFLATYQVELGSGSILPNAAITTILPISLFIIFLLTLYATNIEKQEQSAAIENLRNSVEEMLNNININYNNALMSNEIGLAISKQINIDDILSNTIQILEKRLDYDRGLILLTNEDKTKLLFKTGFGYTFEQFNILKDASFHLDRPESKGVFVISFHKKKPFLINDISEIEACLSLHSLEFAKKMKTKSFICCPIVHEDEPFGVLAVDNVKTKRPLRQSDINLLMGVAPAIGISIHNAKLFKAREQQFQSIIQTLAASIDARDFLTAGHSERVMEYAVGIANEMGLPGDYCKMIRVAALLHDYGKIGIGDSILKKNGKLSFEEYEEIKTHPEKTQKILERINFEGIYRETPKVAGLHHEKIDGSGYPMGLKGEEIPLGSMIIAVADFFEAITSKRHYREAASFDVAIALLMEKSGVHYDDKVVEAFINYYNGNYKDNKTEQYQP